MIDQCQYIGPGGNAGDVTDQNNVMANNTVADVIGNKGDANLAGPGLDSLYGIAAFMAYYHVHSPSLIYPRDDDPVLLTSGAAAWTEGAKTEIVSAGEKTEAFDIHFVVLGNISANDDFVVKLYKGDPGSEVFWGECAFTRDTNQVRGSQVPVQGPPIPAETRISGTVLCGAGLSKTVDVKIYTHEYPA